MNARAWLASVGSALVYATPVLAVLIIVWSPGRLARGEARLSQVVGLASLLFAILCLGVALAMLSLAQDALDPLAAFAVGATVLGVLVAIYGTRRLRTRS